MPDTTPPYTPQIYRRFSTPLRLDLGPTATAVQQTAGLVADVKKVTDALPDVSAVVGSAKTQLDQSIQAAKNETLTFVDTRGKATEANVTASVNGHTDAALVTTRQGVAADVQAALDKASDHIVERLKLPPWPEFREASVVLVRKLIHAMAQAADANPGSVYQGSAKQYAKWLASDVELDQLAGSLAPAELQRLDGAARDLRQRYQDCFKPIETIEPSARLLRMAQIATVMHEVAAHVK